MRLLKHLSPLQQLLVASMSFIVVMIICRIFYSGSLRYIFILWNLFLAWVPLRVSIHLMKEKSAWKSFGFLLVWLLFFPNALYITTDLVHLGGNTDVPVWYDAILLMMAAITGLVMAFASLFNVELFLARKMSLQIVNTLAVIALFLGSFGVYLGRFLRWNSWDIVSNPLDLLQQIAIRFLFPFDYYRTWAVTFLLTVFFSLLYFGMRNLPAHRHRITAR